MTTKINGKKLAVEILIYLLVWAPILAGALAALTVVLNDWWPVIPVCDYGQALMACLIVMLVRIAKAFLDGILLGINES